MTGVVTTRSETTADAGSQRKKDAAVRIRQLLDERKLDRERIADLERQLADGVNELIQLRAEHEQRDAERAVIPGRIAKAVEEGRKMFADFDSVISGVAVDRQAFQALLVSTNGVELMYYAGIGMRVVAQLRQRQAEAQAEQERIEYYRRLNQQHFAGANSNG